MKATDLYARDERKRKAAGWPNGFIAPEFYKPRSKREKKCLALLRKKHPRAISIHVYSVLELMEAAFEIGKEQA